MAIDPSKALGAVLPPAEATWTQDQMILYALGAGIGYGQDPTSKEVLQYTYENGLKALPTYGVIPVFGTLYPIYAKDVFGVGPAGLGLMLTAVGVGGTLGGFIANALGHAERQGAIQAAWVVVMGASIIGIALSPTMVAAIVFSVIGGAAEMAHASSNMAMLQISAPEAMRISVSAMGTVRNSALNSGG